MISKIGNGARSLVEDERFTLRKNYEDMKLFVRKNFNLKILKRIKIIRRSFVNIFIRSHFLEDLHKISFKDLLKILEEMNLWRIQKKIFTRSYLLKKNNKNLSRSLKENSDEELHIFIIFLGRFCQQTRKNFYLLF